MAKAKTPETVARFQSHYNRIQFTEGRTEATNEMPSSAIPNQSLTITEIYKRYASGRPLGGTRQLMYDDDGNGKMVVNFDDYMPDLNTLDLADRQEILFHAKEELERIKKQLNGIAVARKTQAEKENAELKKRLEKLEAEKALPPKDTETEN